MADSCILADIERSYKTERNNYVAMFSVAILHSALHFYNTNGVAATTVRKAATSRVHARYVYAIRDKLLSRHIKDIRRRRISKYDLKRALLKNDESKRILL